MSIKGVLFDFDGVITKSMELHYLAWQRVFDQFDKKIDKLEFYKIEGSGIHNVGRSFIEKFHIDTNLLPGLIEKKRKYYNEIDKFQVYSNLIPVLDFLKLKNILMAIVTGGSFKRVQNSVKNHLDGYFTSIISPERVKQTKPSPEPYLKGAESLNLSPDQCLVIENAPLGIRSGKAAGMEVIAVQTTLPKKYLQQADYIVDNFIQVKILLEELI